MAKHANQLDLILNTVAAPHDLDAYLYLLIAGRLSTFIEMAFAFNEPAQKMMDLIRRFAREISTTYHTFSGKQVRKH
jgi:uncharacterized zinc-type alcohol dehydrogenase-like protein